MSNDYEYLGDSQMPPPMAPRAPSNAHPDLITGLPHTQALKANDDVDLESNRPHGNNNLSFSDNLNPRRSEPSVAGTKTSRSAESDEESKKDTQRNSDSEQEKKNHKCGTCWYIFAGVTIFLAVISLLGLGAFLLLNSISEEPISAALNQTNETSTPEFEPTTLSIQLPTTQVSLDVNSTTTKKVITGKPAKTSTASPNITSTVAPTTSLPTTMTETVTSQPLFEIPTLAVTNGTTSTELISIAEKETTTTEATGQTEQLDDAFSTEETVPPPTPNETPSVEETTPIPLETTTEEIMPDIRDDERPTTDGKVSTEEISNSESTTSGIVAEN